jgi:hypothetical protein
MTSSPTRAIQGILVFGGAMFLAVWLGLSIVTNQFETVLQVITAVLLIGCLAMGRRIWLLIPFAAALDIGLRIPGQPDSLLFAQILVLAFSSLLLLMRKLRCQLIFTELEFWLITLVLFVLQVYLRNPVGISVFGGDTVGGKPYIIFTITAISATLLTGLRVPERDLRLILPLSILGGCLNATISIIGHFVPAVAFYTGASFTRTDEVDYTDHGVAVDTQAATRINFLSTFGRNLSLWICCFVSPLRACFHPLWAGAILVSLAAVAVGGYRNGIAAVGLTYLVAIAYRSGLAGVMLSLFGGAGVIALLAIVNLAVPLPPNVQRGLTIFPGTWEQRYKDDTKDSTDWRIEIWKEALFTDRWIQNKLIGDGLGFSAAELAAQMNYREGTRLGVSGFESHREAVLSNGDYHSGPVSMIRTIGYLGLLVFVIIQIRLAVHAHRLIVRYKGTTWQPLTMLVGTPIIWAPVFFLFVFGDFKNDTAFLLLSLGLIRLLQNNLPVPIPVGTQPAMGQRQIPNRQAEVIALRRH